MKLRGSRSRAIRRRRGISTSCRVDNTELIIINCHSQKFPRTILWSHHAGYNELSPGSSYHLHTLTFKLGFRLAAALVRDNPKRNFFKLCPLEYTFGMT